MEKAIRKQRMTKAQVMQLVDWMMEHAEEVGNMSNGRIAQLYEEQTGIIVSSYVVKNNRYKWIKHDGALYKKNMPWLYESSAPVAEEPAGVLDDCSTSGESSTTMP